MAFYGIDLPLITTEIAGQSYRIHDIMDQGGLLDPMNYPLVDKPAANLYAFDPSLRDTPATGSPFEPPNGQGGHSGGAGATGDWQPHEERREEPSGAPQPCDLHPFPGKIWNPIKNNSNWYPGWICIWKYVVITDVTTSHWSEYGGRWITDAMTSTNATYTLFDDFPASIGRDVLEECPKWLYIQTSQSYSYTCWRSASYCPTRNPAWGPIYCRRSQMCIGWSAAGGENWPSKETPATMTTTDYLYWYCPVVLAPRIKGAGGVPPVTAMIPTALTVGGSAAAIAAVASRLHFLVKL